MSMEWWRDPDMTSSAAIARAAEQARVLIEYHPQIELVDETGHAVEVPVILIDAHGGPWVIYPDPEAILGWLAAQIDLHHDGAFTLVTETHGWLGAGDLEADRLIANLTDADRLPTNIWMTDHVSTTRRTTAGESAETEPRRAQTPYRSPDDPGLRSDEGRKQQWNR